MADLKGIGRILGVLGGIIMVVFAILIAVREVAYELVEAMEDIINLTTLNIAGEAGLDWIVSVAITLVCGIIAIYGYMQLASRDKGALILWGIIYIVIGLVGGTIGGLIVLIGGIILVIDYFI
ncbi:MAG: hypothetical protein ACFFAJ_03125 [Candidatus Hodarchaeota archaeon]